MVGKMTEQNRNDLRGFLQDGAFSGVKFAVLQLELIQQRGRHA